MASSPITSWEVGGETMGTVTDFIFLGSKITVDVDYSHEIKGWLLLGRKVITNLDSILKSRDITLPTKVHLVKPMVLPVAMYGYEIWTIKKAENWRTDPFELWCSRRLLRVPWTERRSTPSILKEISPVCSLEGLMLKLKLQYFGHLMRRTDSLRKRLRCWERLKAGGEESERGWYSCMALLTRWTWVWTNSRTWWWTGKPGMLISLSIMPLRFIQYVVFISSLLLLWTSSNCSVVSDSLRPHGLQHTRPITNFQSLRKLMSIEAVIPSNHLILCHPLLFLPSIFPSIRIFSNESILCIR